MEVLHKLFVYGTLAPGQPNEHILAAIGGIWTEGTVRGTLYEEGWGASMGYPALLLDPAGERVKGFVFTSEKLPEHWQELDSFEGEAYKRVLTTIDLGEGHYTKAYIYTLNQSPK